MERGPDIPTVDRYRMITTKHRANVTQMQNYVTKCSLPLQIRYREYYNMEESIKKPTNAPIQGIAVYNFPSTKIIYQFD